MQTVTLQFAFSIFTSIFLPQVCSKGQEDTPGSPHHPCPQCRWWKIQREHWTKLLQGHRHHLSWSGSFWHAVLWLESLLLPSGQFYQECSESAHRWEGSLGTQGVSHHYPHVNFGKARQIVETFVSQFPLQQPPVVLLIKMQIKH